MHFRSDLIGRSWRVGWFLLCVSVAFLVSTGAGRAQKLVLPAIDKSREAAALKAAARLDDNPADIEAVVSVCTQCHSSSQFLGKPRTSSGWEQIYGQMARNGARPTNEQIDQIVRYFQRNLTLVDVNSASAEELAATIPVGAGTVSSIVKRRSQRPFTGIDDLAGIKGMDRHILAKLKDRLQF
jgi:hypothetical protein